MSVVNALYEKGNEAAKEAGAMVQDTYDLSKEGGNVIYKFGKAAIKMANKWNCEKELQVTLRGRARISDASRLSTDSVCVLHP